MASWTDLLANKKDSESQVFEGAISRAPATLSDFAIVTLEAFDDEQEWGPCPWEPRINISGDPIKPSVGDRCVVVMAQTTDTGEPEPWVVAWWPYE